ncbi:MAG: TfoX/Sxy family protein [Flavitalea sp.]
MAYDEALANRIRELLFEIVTDIEEKAMFGGLCFMVNKKMCVGIFRNELMCRVDPGQYPFLLEKTGCRSMEMGGKEMKGYILVDPEQVSSKKELRTWVNLCLEFNPRAKASKK